MEQLLAQGLYSGMMQDSMLKINTQYSHSVKILSYMFLLFFSTKCT